MDSQVVFLNDLGYSKSKKQYTSTLSFGINRKGVFDIDSVKGCSCGIAKYPNGGCYGNCYAFKTAERYGIDFSHSVSRTTIQNGLTESLERHNLSWFRIGTMGDPSHDWQNTLYICRLFGKVKTPIIITKYWREIPESYLPELFSIGAIINTSISPLDSTEEIEYRLAQFNRLKKSGIKSVLRIVSVEPGKNETGKMLREKQDMLFENWPFIDNPLRISQNSAMVSKGDIFVSRVMDINTPATISICRKKAYIGKCEDCPDQCGVSFFEKQTNKTGEHMPEQLGLFNQNIELEYVKSVIGSGYEKQVADLAIRDKIAYRAARKNMQIHSAIILKSDGQFSGFFTFQVNHEVGEFCLLQSAMELDRKDKTIYKMMLQEIIKQNTFGYPMIMTVSTQHDLERPDVLADVGFKTYLELSGFEYMVYGTFDQIRMKRLAHATMTNVWNTVKSDWLKMKREWNEKIDKAGEKHGVPNPRLASREGCWQGKNGMANIVLSTRKIEDGEIKHDKGKTLNENASVLDPVACEVILRFFMPTNGRRVYNPFGGGVQFGFVSGSYGYEYVSSEIRQNQCDANNKICGEFKSAKWIKSDSSKYDPEGMFDLVFSCPPYYKVEKYLDYDGKAPDGEINSLPSYEQFRDTLFEGYKKAMAHLNENCFFVIMTGDSRDGDGAYYCCEAEHEMFLKGQGLKIYNKIIYLECEFTRLAQAKVTMNTRKFPKREQKIIVAFKGDISEIKNLYKPLGRL